MLAPGNTSDLKVRDKGRVYTKHKYTFHLENHFQQIFFGLNDRTLGSAHELKKNQLVNLLRHWRNVRGRNQPGH
jgi:hypothetical protein